MITVLNSNDSGAGSLRQAIADAAPAEVITFDPGALPLIQLTSGELFIDKDLTITGPGAANLTIQRGAGSFRVFHILSPSSPTLVTVNITGLTVENGEETAANGGGIFNEFCDLTLNDVVLSNNSAVNGGGIWTDSSSTVTLEVVTFGSNAADSSGGGIFVDGVALMDNCTFNRNTAINVDGTGAFGGGVFVSGNSTMTDCLLRDNIASGGAAAGGGFGGGILNDGTLEMDNCELVSNTATGGSGSGIANGGGLDNRFGTAQLSRCTIRENEAIGGAGAGATGAAAYGGGIMNEFGSLYLGGSEGTIVDPLLGCTIRDNTVQGGDGSSDGGNSHGGGLYTFVGTTYIGLSTFSGNQSTGGFGSTNGGGGYGGAIDNDSGSVFLRTSTVSGNSAIAGLGGTTNGFPFGGGIFNGAGAIAINNSTITDNTTSDGSDGGGLSTFAGFTELKNTIVAVNNATLDIYTDVGGGGTTSTNGYNCVGTATGFTPGTGDQAGVTALTLKLGPLQNNGGLTHTHALLTGSVAINTGDPTPDALSPTCQRGLPRVVNSTQDVGAYEVQPSTGNWSVQVAAPFTGYVYVVNVSGGSYTPAYRFYAGETTDQTNQDFAFTGTA